MIPIFETIEGRWNFEELIKSMDDIIIGLVLLKEYSSKIVPAEYVRKLNKSKKAIESVKELLIELQAKL